MPCEGGDTSGLMAALAALPRAARLEAPGGARPAAGDLVTQPLESRFAWTRRNVGSADDAENLLSDQRRRRWSSQPVPAASEGSVTQPPCILRPR